VNVWDSSGKELSRPVIHCGAKPVVVGGTGAATMRWIIFVFDKTYAEVKQCESQQPNTPVSGGRFPCKAGGNVSATLTFKPQ
jgi:hypothetical protein